MPTLTPIAEIELAEGVRVVDLGTTQECDEWLFALARDLASIDAQLDKFESDARRSPPNDQEADWARRARSARRVRAALRNLVTNRRADIVRGERHHHSELLLNRIKMRLPDQFAEIAAEIEREQGSVT